MDQPDWVPEGVDVTVPNAARVYDYALGGYHNFSVDREFCDQAERIWPGASLIAHANRAFLGRAVEWLVDAGVRQFLDIGSGIPTLGNVHEVAQAAAPDARIMYVDIDPVAVSHSRAILADNPHAWAIHSDLRRPDEVLYHPDVLQLLDFSQPIAVLLIAVLHFISDDDDPQGIIAQLTGALLPGSYVAISHGTPTAEDEDRQEQVRRLYDRTPTPVHLRTLDQVAGLLTGLEIVEPGVVPVTAWHPDPDATGDPQRPNVLAAVGRKA